MKKLLVILLFITSKSFSQRVEHVVLITVDGFRPQLYLDSSFGMTNVHKLMQDGTYSEGVNSVFPSMTYPSHTTIVTGVQPAKHGVYFNNMFEPNGPTGKMYWNDSSIHSPTIWAAAEKKGMIVAALFGYCRGRIEKCGYLG